MVGQKVHELDKGGMQNKVKCELAMSKGARLSIVAPALYLSVFADTHTHTRTHTHARTHTHTHAHTHTHTHAHIHTHTRTHTHTYTGFRARMAGRVTGRAKLIEQQRDREAEVAPPPRRRPLLLDIQPLAPDADAAIVLESVRLGHPRPPKPGEEGEGGEEREEGEGGEGTEVLESTGALPLPAISLRIDFGEHCALVGANGIGKVSPFHPAGLYNTRQCIARYTYLSFTFHLSLSPSLPLSLVSFT